MADLTEVARDGESWRLGTAEDVEWITSGTTIGRTIQSAMPTVFDSYATITLPEEDHEQRRHDEALLAVLRAHTPEQPWWLGYLETGGDDVVFPDAPRVILYAGWKYVVVLAGPDQAATWRASRFGAFWKGSLPSLMFPADRSWLMSTLWDDDWTSVGGPSPLVDALLSHPEFTGRGQNVLPGQDATPPGRQSF